MKLCAAIRKEAERNGFTLIELLLASMLSVVLMAGVLIVLSGVSRDATKIAAEPLTDGQKIFDLLQWDLTNARTMVQSPDGTKLILIGHGSFAPGTMQPLNRLVRVTYSCRRQGAIACFVRDQEFLDEPVRPEKWSELVATGITSIAVIPLQVQQPLDPQMIAADGSELPASIAANQLARVPSWVRLRISGPSLNAEKQLCVK